METTYNDSRLWDRNNIYENHGGEIREGSVFTLLALPDLERPWVRLNCFSWFDNLKQAAGYFKYIILADELSIQLGFFDSEDRNDFEFRFREFVESSRYVPRKHRKYLEIWNDTDQIFEVEPRRAKMLFMNLVHRYNALFCEEKQGEGFFIFENIYAFNAFVNNHFAGNEGFDTETFNKCCCQDKLCAENFNNFMLSLNVTCDAKQFYQGEYRKHLGFLCGTTWLQTMLVIALLHKIFVGSMIQLNKFSLSVAVFSFLVTLFAVAKGLYTPFALKAEIS